MLERTVSNSVINCIFMMMMWSFFSCALERCMESSGSFSQILPFVGRLKWMDEEKMFLICKGDDRIKNNNNKRVGFPACILHRLLFGSNVALSVALFF